MMKKVLKLLRLVITFPCDIWQMFITYLPGPVGFRLRYRFWKKRLKYLGSNVRIDIGVHFQNPHFISIDDNSWIDRNVLILAGSPGTERKVFNKILYTEFVDIGNVKIGKNVHIGPNCVLSGIGGLSIGNNCGIASNSTIYSFSHHYRNLLDMTDTNQYSFTPMARSDQQSMVLGTVVLEDFCAVGLNSVILPGTFLKRGTWVTSGTVVMGKYEEQSVIKIDRKEIIKSIKHLKIIE